MSSANKPDSGQGSNSGQSNAHPAAHPEPQTAPADKGAAPRPDAKPVSDTPSAATAPTAHPAADKTPGDPGADGAVARTAPAHTKPEPSTPEAAPPPAPGAPPRSDPASANQGAPGPRPPAERQPAPGSTCEQGHDCAPAPAPPPPGAPPPSGPSSAGSGSGAGGPGGPHHQPGADDGSWFSSFLANQRPSTPPQPGAPGSDSYNPNAGRGPPQGAPQPMMIPHDAPSSPLITLPHTPGAAPQDDTSRSGGPTPPRATPSPADTDLPGPLGTDAHPRDPRQAGQEFYQGLLTSKGKAADRLRGLSPDQVDQLAAQGPPRTAEDVLNLATGTRPAAPGTSEEWDRQQAVKAWFADSRDHPEDFNRFAAALPYAERVKLEQAFEDNKPTNNPFERGAATYWGKQLEQGARDFFDWSDRVTGKPPTSDSWNDRTKRSARNLIAQLPAGLGKALDDLDTERSNFNPQPLIGESPEHADQRLHPFTEDVKEAAQPYRDELGPIVTHRDPGKLGSDFYHDPVGTAARYVPFGQVSKFGALKGLGKLGKEAPAAESSAAAPAAAGTRLTDTPAEPAPGAPPPPAAGKPSDPPPGTTTTPAPSGLRVLPRPGTGKTPQTPTGPGGPKPPAKPGAKPDGQADRAPAGPAGGSPGVRTTRGRPTGRDDNNAMAGAGARTGGPNREPLTNSANSNRAGPRAKNNTPNDTTLTAGRRAPARDGTPPQDSVGTPRPAQKGQQPGSSSEPTPTPTGGPKRTTLLGRYATMKQYIREHPDEKLDADFLNIRGTMANGKKGPGGWTWSRNKRYIDDAIARGDDIRLVTNPNKPLYSGGNTYQRELKYLQDKGYSWRPNGDHWVLVRTRP